MILNKMQTHGSPLNISAQFLNKTRCKLYSYHSKRSTIGHAPLHYYSYNTEKTNSVATTKSSGTSNTYFNMGHINRTI